MSPSIVSDTTLPANVPESRQTAANALTKDVFSMEDRTVIVTGAGRGLGITLAKAVLEAGGDAVCLDILPQPRQSEWDDITKIQKVFNAQATYYRCDVMKEEDVKATLAEAASAADNRRKPIRGLMVDAMEYPIDGFKRILEGDVTGSFLMAKYTARLMQDAKTSGSIVLVASMSGQIANRGLHCSAYNTSKAAVQQMCRSLAAEWGRYGIRVNSLSPGYIRTAMTDQLLAEKPEIEELWMDGALLGRLGAPEDFKAPTVFLLCDGASFMTGADLRVDGGHCASA